MQPVIPPSARSQGISGSPRDEHFVRCIYLTIQNPAEWEAVLRKIAAATASSSAGMLIKGAGANPNASSICISTHHAFSRQIIDCCLNRCSLGPGSSRETAGGFSPVYLHFNHAQPKFHCSRLFTDSAASHDSLHGACGSVYCARHQSIRLLILRSSEQGPYSEADIAFVNRLLPHIHHALFISGEVLRAGARAEAIALASEHVLLPFLLLDRTFTVVYRSPGAEHLLGRTAPLVISDGKLLVTEEWPNRLLQRLIKQSLHLSPDLKGHKEMAKLLIPRLNRSGMQLLVKAFTIDSPGLPCQRDTYAAVYIFESEPPVRIDPQRLQDIYSLSRAEARVAIALVETPDSAEIARRCCVSLHTVRSHLKSIFFKTQSRNRVELIKRFLTGPARLL